MSGFNANPNPNPNPNQSTPIDSLLLRSLMGRLQLASPYLNTNSCLSQSFEDLLLDNNIEDEGEKTELAREESKLEKEIIKVILSGKTETLKPNSGQAVTIGEHHICVGFHKESGSDYRVWEWHGHIMLFDDENGYTPEYIYGNYFERVQAKGDGGNDDEKEGQAVNDDEKEGPSGNLGLRELIGNDDSLTGRILCRNMNMGSTR